MKSSALSGDAERAHYLELCEKLLDHASDMRSYAMKPDNTWLARGELGKISDLLSQLESTHDEIKAADEA